MYHVCNVCMRSLARASEMMYFQVSKYICIHLHTYIHSIAVPFYYFRYGAIKWQYTDKTLTLRKSMKMRASELRKFSHLLLLPSIFCWYFRYFVSETYVHVSNYICIDIQSMQFPFITYGMVLSNRQYADKTLILRKSMYIYMRTSLEFFCILTF